MSEAVGALRSFDAAVFRGILAGDPALARKPQLMVEAARGARLGALRMLVRGGGDLNSFWRGYRPLHALIQEKPHGAGQATDNNRLRCLDWFLEHGADPELPGGWPAARAVLIAAFTGVSQYVDHLLKAGARRDLHVACALGDVARVRRALKQGGGFCNARDEFGYTALQCCAASRLGNSDRRVHRNLMRIATLLLDAGADLHARTRSWDHEVDATGFAVAVGNAELLDLLLRHGADADAALIAAVWDKEDSSAKLCLSYGADVNRARDGDKPLLNQMVRWGRFRWVSWLLAKGADPNLPDARGWTAVHQAAARGNRRIFQALLSAGGDCRRKDASGRTSLELANMKTREQ